MFQALSQWRPLREAGLHLLVLLAYVAAVEVGMQFVLPQANLSLVYPATGVGLALVYLLGLRFAVTVGVAAVVAGLLNDKALIAAAAVGMGSGVASLAGAWALQRVRVRPALDRLRDIVHLVIFGALLSSVISSGVGSATMYLAGQAQWDGFGSLWWVCWVAEMVGALLITPVIFTASAGATRAWTPGHIAEAGLMATAVGVAGWVVYADVLPPGVAMAKPLSYVVFPLMIWAATRCLSREVTLLLFMHAAIAIGYTANNQGPFAGGTLRENLLSLHAQLAMLSISVLMLQAAMGERRHAEAALRESEAKYRLLVENQTDLVVKMDATGNILFASPSVAELFGAEEGVLLGRPFRTLLPGARADERPWADLFYPPHACYVEHPVQTVKGERWLGWAAKAVLDDHGRVAAVVAVGRDVTARRRAEAESREYLQELAHVGRISAMGEMAAGLAHELNQPLCSIMTFSQAAGRLLDRPEREQDLRHAIERTAANAERAGEIIRQMRSFVRKDEPELTDADVNDIVSDVVELTAAEANQNDVAVKADLARALPPVSVATIQIHQVLVNLIRNAIEALAGAGGEDRRVVVRTRQRPNGAVEVSVDDNGPGISFDVQQELFEPFVSTKRSGMGLGLSISRSIIEAHGGTMHVDSAPGRGTVFRFELPASAERESAAV
ncbi:MASE1 domain-containing protein [Ectothiorhodospiraceae bacterium WFHF3C12]|nr:MASE1 domain-containing protein [Ectothiorhodospiraceae bacterium WFHF3C12]